MKNQKIVTIVLSIFLGAATCHAGAVEVPIDIEDGVGLAAAVSHPTPVYSKVALQLKLEGRVGIGAYVDKDGSVYETVISFGNPVLVQMAVSTVKEWKFKPFLNEQGQPAKALVRLTFDLKPPAKQEKSK